MNDVNNANGSGGRFDRAVRHLAELSAISRLSDYKTAVQELVLQSIAVADPFSIRGPSDVVDVIDAFFGIPLERPLVDSTVAFLAENDRIRLSLGAYTLSEAEQTLRSQRLTESQQLETNVFEHWNAQLIQQQGLTVIVFDDLTKCMRDYLSRAFRQHGIETAQILDSTSQLANISTESLVHILNETVSKHFKESTKAAIARAHITEFFKSLEKFPERRKYLVELADGAYSFYTFFIDPDISRKLKDTLRKIDFYLDTNFLWSLLGLHQNQYVDASLELFSIVKAHNLPFAFRYHKETERELIRSVAGSSAALRSKAWKPSVSTTLKNSPYVSGIERQYHEKNAKRGTDVDMFLKPFESISRIVQDQGIKLDSADVEWSAEVNDLLHDFTGYLESIEKEKTYEAMQHDVRLLWLVRRKRTNSKSPLQAGTLFLTCDTRLYNFDVRNSCHRQVFPSTILPNVLLQILRPVVKTTDDFDTLFAKTFALPEFRSYSKKSSLAVQKMAEILSAVEGLSSAIAEQMLLDDLLVKDVSRAKSEGEVVDKINAAVVNRLAGFEEELAHAKRELARLAERAASDQRSAAVGAEQTAAELLRLKQVAAQNESRANMEAARALESVDAAEKASRIARENEAKAVVLADLLAKQSARINTIKAYAKYGCMLLVVASVSIVAAWASPRVLVPLANLLDRTHLAIAMGLIVFIGLHLLLELSVGRREISGIWPFIRIRLLRRWLWGVVFLGFFAGVIGNIYANRIQRKLDEASNGSNIGMPANPGSASSK